MQKRQISQKISSNHLLILKQRKVLKCFPSHGFEIKDKLCVSRLNTSSKYKEKLRKIKNAEKSKNEEEKIDALLSNKEEIKHQ